MTSPHNFTTNTFKATRACWGTGARGTPSRFIRGNITVATTMPGQPLRGTEARIAHPSRFTGEDSLHATNPAPNPTISTTDSTTTSSRPRPSRFTAVNLTSTTTTLISSMPSQPLRGIEARLANPSRFPGEDSLPATNPATSTTVSTTTSRPRPSRFTPVNLTSTTTSSSSSMPSQLLRETEASLAQHHPSIPCPPMESRLPPQVPEATRESEDPSWLANNAANFTTTSFFMGDTTLNRYLQQQQQQPTSSSVETPTIDSCSQATISPEHDEDGTFTRDCREQYGMGPETLLQQVILLQQQQQQQQQPPVTTSVEPSVAASPSVRACSPPHLACHEPTYGSPVPPDPAPMSKAKATSIQVWVESQPGHPLRAFPKARPLKRLQAPTPEAEMAAALPAPADPAPLPEEKARSIQQWIDFKSVNPIRAFSKARPFRRPPAAIAEPETAAPSPVPVPCNRRDRKIDQLTRLEAGQPVIVGPRSWCSRARPQPSMRERFALLEQADAPVFRVEVPPITPPSGDDVDDTPILDYDAWQKRFELAETRRQERQRQCDLEPEAERSAGVFETIKGWASRAWETVKMAVWG